MSTVDNSTQLVTSTESGTGWSVDVTACNLDPDLTLKDFFVKFEDAIQPLTDFTKTSVTIITYSGSAIPSTLVEIGRNTPIERIRCVTFGDRLQSAEYEAELNRIHKLIAEEELAFSVQSSQVRVSSDDTTADYLDEKITTSDGVEKAVNSPGGDEELDLSLADAVIKVSPDDTTRGDLETKIVGGTNVSITVLNPGADERLQISAAGGGGGGGNLIGIGLITTEIATVVSPTPGTKVWLSATGRDSVGDGGEGLFWWDEADITSTADDGVIYLVQGGAGTGRWKRFREDKKWWDVRWYGVVADASTDNFPALERMRVTIQTFYNDQVNTIFFPGAALSYDYSENTWIRQLRHVRLDGYGAILRNTDSISAFSSDRYPVRVVGFLTDNGGVRTSAFRAWKTTYGVVTVAPGETLLTFVNPGDGTNFVVGEEVIITGRQRQNGGYPPNMTYFELHRVEAVTANDITFEQPLKYGYRDDWYSSQPQLTTGPDHVFGPGSIFKVETAATIPCLTFEARGIRFADNPNFGGGSKFTLRGVYWGRVIDCIFDDIMYAAESLNVQVLNTRVKEFEIDKLIEVCEVNNSSVGGNGQESLVAATGVRKLIFKNNQITGRIRVMPIELALIENNTVTAIAAVTDAPIRADGTNTCLKFIARHNTIRSPDIIPGTTVDPVGTAFSLTVDAVSGTDIVLTDSGANREIAYQDLAEGIVIHNGDATNIGRVVRVTGGNGTDITIEGTWENVPVVSEVYYWTPVQSSIVENNTWEDEVNGVSRGSQPTSIPRSFDGTFFPFQNEATKVVTLTSDIWAFSGTNTVRLRAIIERIEFEVSRIYSGAFGGSVDCEISRFATPTSPTPGSGLRQRIDLKTLGVRSISANPWQSLTPVAGANDQIVLSEVGQYADRLQLRFRQGASDLGPENHWDLAGGVVRLYLRNPRASHTSIPINLSSASI